MLRRYLSKASKHSHGLHFAPNYARFEAKVNSKELEVISAVIQKFQPKQEELVQLRTTEAFRKQFSPQYRELERVAGPSSRFDLLGVPKDLHDRKVELTGPSSDPTMVVTALNSKKDGVSCFMGDAEDASTMSAANTLSTLETNYAVARRTLSAEKTDADGNVKKYDLAKDLATYIFRVPGLHLPLPSVTLHDQSVSAFLFHTAMYAAQNGEALKAAGSGTYFYVPKLEGAAEAEFVNSVYNYVEDLLSWPRGTIKASVLVESWPTLVELPRVVEAFKKDNHIVAINAARWDYFAHLHKSFRNQQFAPRSALTMELPFMREYVQRIVHVGHHYGIHSIGGMSAFIPVKDEEVNRVAMEKAKADKELEYQSGMDGAWIAHPGMANIREVFDRMGQRIPNQIDSARPSDAVNIQSVAPRFENLRVTSDDIRFNIRIALEYLSAWIAGRGAVALNNMMEDSATMEISRYNLWNHRRHHVRLADGGALVDEKLLKSLAKDELQKLKDGNTQVPYAAASFDSAYEILMNSILTDAPPSYLTLPALNALKEGKAANILSSSQVGSFNFGPEKTFKYGYFDRRGLNLAIYRGLALNKLVHEKKKPVVFLGCYTGPVAQQYARFGAHLYGGGWQGNAAANRDRQPYPDTLFVTQGDAYDVSELFTNYLEAAKINQELTIFEKSEGFNKSSKLSAEEREKKISALKKDRIDYEAISVLIDGENGWGSEDKVINLVRNLVKRGVNLIHIEDQIEKRCGHIGGKSVHKTETMRRLYEAARWVLHELEGHEGKQILGVVQIIARTDALDARFFDGSANFPTFAESQLHDELVNMNMEHEVAQGIIDHFITQKYVRIVDRHDGSKRYLRFTSKFSEHAYKEKVNMALRKDLLAPTLHAIEKNPAFVPLDHRFVDWDKGHTPDGRFWYLREHCGLALSIHRMVNVMDLCDFGWMETKDPRIDEVKEFIEGVREYRDYFGQQPYKDFKALYNLSPSFNWLYNFGKEAAGLTKNLAEKFSKQGPMNAEQGKKWVRDFFATSGDLDQGDAEYKDEVYQSIFNSLQKGTINSNEGMRMVSDVVENVEQDGQLCTGDASKLNTLITELRAPFKANDTIQLTIAEERMRLFSRKIFECGCSLQLITLPEFHFDQLMAAKLADSFVGDDQGMLAYTRLVQHPEFVMRDSRGYDGVTHQRKAMLDFWQSVLQLLNPERPDLAQKAGVAHTEGQMDKSWKSS